MSNSSSQRSAQSFGEKLIQSLRELLGANSAGSAVGHLSCEAYYVTSAAAHSP